MSIKSSPFSVIVLPSYIIPFNQTTTYLYFPQPPFSTSYPFWSVEVIYISARSVKETGIFHSRRTPYLHLQPAWQSAHKADLINKTKVKVEKTYTIYVIIHIKCSFKIKPNRSCGKALNGIEVDVNLLLHGQDSQPNRRPPV